MANALWPKILLGYSAEEAIPTLRPVPGVDLIAYCHTLIERFGNPVLADRLTRLWEYTADRIQNFLLPVEGEQLDVGSARIRRSAAIVTSRARYTEGTDEHGNPIKVMDMLNGPLMAAAARDSLPRKSRRVRQPDRQTALRAAPIPTRPPCCTTRKPVHWRRHAASFDPLGGHAVFERFWAGQD